MSEPMFPGQPAPAHGEPTAAAPEGGGNRKALLAVGGIVGAVLLAGGAFVLMNSGSGSTDASSNLAPKAPRQAASSPAAAPSAAVAPIKVTKVSVTSRDPFAPLYPTPVAAPTSAAAAPAAAPAVTQAPSVTLELSSVNLASQKAGVTVNGKPYTASVGQGFGTNYLLYGIFNSQCAGVLFGDQSVAVCMGKPMTVQP